MHKDYYEGVLQLRNPNEKVIEFIRKALSEEKTVFITKETQVTDGIDLYFTSQRFLQCMGRMLKRHFPGELVLSPKIHTKNRQTSKDVYRVNVLFRLSRHNVNDVLSYRGERIKITNLGGKVYAKSLDSGKKMSINYKDL